jgi:hypothetical protein
LRLPEEFTSAFLVFGDLLAALLALFERVVRFGCSNSHFEINRVLTPF